VPSIERVCIVFAVSPPKLSIALGSGQHYFKRRPQGDLDYSDHAWGCPRSDTGWQEDLVLVVDADADWDVRKLLDGDLNGVNTFGGEP